MIEEGSTGRPGEIADLQGGQHVTWRNAVDPNVGLSPLDGKGGGEVSDGGFGGVVRAVARTRWVSRYAGERGRGREGVLRLRLGNVHDGAAHAADEDHAPWGFASHLVEWEVSISQLTTSAE